MGQELVSAVLIPRLRAGDEIYSNHRGHGHYLARSGDIRGLVTEVLGRLDSPSGGWGGSQHMRAHNFWTTGIQGAGVSWACGTALRSKIAGTSDIAVAFTGDGTWGQGIVYEALNFASLKSLPLLIVVEHNGISQSTPSSRNSGAPISDRAAGFGAKVAEVAGNDRDALAAATSAVLTHVREKSRPAVLIAHVPRLGPHSWRDETRPDEVMDVVRSHDWTLPVRETDPAAFDTAVEDARRHVCQVLGTFGLSAPEGWKIKI